MARTVTADRIFRFGLFEADVARCTLTRKGVRIRIQEQPFRVLLLLLERPGEIVTREELRRQLWPEGTFVDFDGSLNVILKKLRFALDDDPDKPRFIETVPRRGYRFIAPVALEPAKSDSSPPFPAPAISAAPVQLEPTLPARRPRSLFGIGVVAVLVLAAAVFLVWLVRRHSDKPILSLQANAAVPMRRSLAILGFHNLSARPEDAWLSTAFSEMLSTELAGGEKLRLVSGEEVANLRLSSPWPQTDSLDSSSTQRIGSALNSDLLILGSYTTTGARERPQLRLDIRLQNARTGEILTEIAQTGDRDDLFQLVSSVGAKLRLRLGIPQLAEPAQASVAATMPLNREAARLYALGLSKLREFDAQTAKDLLQQACNADAKFALGHAMLARAWSQLGYEQKRKQEAKKALDLSGPLSRTDQMLVEGDYYESVSDHEKAASTYRALYELFPDSVDYGLQLAAALNAGGHHTQASETLAQLRRLPPPASDDPRIDLLDARAGPTNDPARLVLIHSAMRKASAQGKKLVYAQARKEECLNLNYSDHPDQGPPACEEAYNIYQAAGNQLGAADAIRLLGDNEGSRGHLDAAIATYQRALNLLQQTGEHYKTGAILNNMAIGFANEGKLDRAEQLYRQAKFHFDEAGDKENTATAIGNIADIVFLRGELVSAAKLYQQAIDIEAALDHNHPGYLHYRLADLKLAEGRVQEAHVLAQQAVDGLRQDQGGYQYLTGAMIELGEVFMAENNLEAAHQQFESAHDIDQKVGEAEVAGESQVELADLALDQGHPDQAEPLLRAAIAEFEKEKADPDATSAYTVLSRSLLMQGKNDEALKAVQHASDLDRANPDPALKLAIAIQRARVEEAGAQHAGDSAFAPARRDLQSAIDTAKKLGYYHVECEARLALGELLLKQNATAGRSQLTALAHEARSHGLERIAKQAEHLLAGSPAAATSAT